MTAGGGPPPIVQRVPPVTIATPCIGICVIEDDDLCRGCARTIDEIAGWGMMTAAARAAVMATLPARRLPKAR